MAEFDSASRFALVESANRSPGVDLITKSPNGPFVDTGLDLNKFDPVFAEANYARVYLSLDTLREMAEGAGLFDPLRAELLGAEHRGHQIGYADAIKENLSESVHDLSVRLGDLADRLAAPAAVADAPNAGEGGYEEPLVLVFDGGDAPRRLDRADESNDTAGKSSRQGDGTRRNQRPNRVSAGAVDGNPFRI